MRHVIIRDDDTNAFTPIECLEGLYRPFLDKGMPVNLATIPNVRSDVKLPTGEPEGFLVARNGAPAGTYPLAGSKSLVKYLHANPGYRIVQHGYHHEFINNLTEFDHSNRRDIANRLDRGTRLLLEAGFPKPKVFVAPYDRMTRISYEEIARRFKVISTGWFEARRIPYTWWPFFLFKKALKRPHWKAGSTILLSHPGCHLSYHRPYGAILENIRKSVEGSKLTVLVTHWWEFYRNNQPDQPFIDVLHETADWLSKQKDVRVISFEDVAEGRVALN
jgi:hypothetical protein